MNELDLHYAQIIRTGQAALDKTKPAPRHTPALIPNTKESASHELHDAPRL